MGKLSRRFVLVLALMSAGAPFAGGADMQPAERNGKRQIPFKQPESSTSELILRVLGGLAVVALVGTGAVYLIRRYFPSAYHPAFGGASRIKVIEVRRLTPKVNLFVIEFDDARLLLGHSGDRITTLCKSRATVGDSDIDKT